MARLSFDEPGGNWGRSSCKGLGGLLILTTRRTGYPEPIFCAVFSTKTQASTHFTSESLCRGSNLIPWLLFFCSLNFCYFNLFLWEGHGRNQEYCLLALTCLEPTVMHNFPDFMSPGLHVQGGDSRIPQPTVPKETAYKARLRPFLPQW